MKKEKKYIYKLRGFSYLSNKKLLSSDMSLETQCHVLNTFISDICAIVFVFLAFNNIIPLTRMQGSTQ